MPKPNIYLNQEEFKTIINTITYYMSMWDDAETNLDKKEQKKLIKIKQKLNDYKNITHE